MVTVDGATGLVAALAPTTSLRSLLYGVQPHNPLTFLATPLLLAAVALAACLAPALRAASVDPGRALHDE